MKKKITLLGGLLVLQAVLILATTFRSEGLQGHQGMQALLDFNREQIDRIVLADGEQSAELQRAGDTWTTAEGFPVEADRVDRLLDKLKELQHGLVVAQTDASLKRFKLTEDAFERRVELYADGKEVASLTLGSGAGARRSHVRTGEAKEIYAVALGSYDLPTDLGQWQDKTLLQLDADRVERVRIGDLIVRKEVTETDAVEGGDSESEPEVTWVAEAIEDGKVFEADDFQREIERLFSLRYNRAHSGVKLNDLVENKTPLNTLTIVLSDGSERSYQVFKAKAGSEHFLKVSDREEVFQLDAYTGAGLSERLAFSQLIQTDAALVEETAEPEAATSSDAHSSEASDSETAENEAEANLNEES